MVERIHDLYASLSISMCHYYNLFFESRRGGAVLVPPDVVPSNHIVFICDGAQMYSVQDDIHMINRSSCSSYQ